MLWLLLDDRVGNRSQCLGVAEALSLPYQTKELTYSKWAGLPNFLLKSSLIGLSGSSRKEIQAPWPDIVISAGRRTAPVAQAIKRLSKDQTKLVQLMWPGTGSEAKFDLLCVPNHDVAPHSDQIFRMTGAPNGLQPHDPQSDASAGKNPWGELPAPRIALLCGGSTKNRRFTQNMGADLGQKANGLAAGAGGSLLVTTSRRTGDAAETLLKELDVPSHIHQWNDGGDNPYRQYLDVADAIIVTGDSMSMCSEACSTGKPVYIFAPQELITEKHNRLHQELFNLGCARPMTEHFETWHYKPLNAAEQIAEEIQRRFLNATEV